MKDLWLSANTDKLQADKKHIHFFLLALWPLGKIWIQHHQSREQNLLITDCDNIRQSNISASALFLYGCWGWCVRLHLPLAHLEPNDLLNLSQQWHLCRTTEKFLWMPSLLKAEKQVTKSQQNNCTEFLLDLASVNLLTKLTSNSYCWDIWDKGGKKKKRHSDLIVTSADNAGTPSYSLGILSWIPSCSFYTQREKLLILGKPQNILNNFCHSANLKVERKISTLRRFHWSAKIHCHIKLTWTLEPHRKNIKVWESVPWKE